MNLRQSFRLSASGHAHRITPRCDVESGKQYVTVHRLKETVNGRDYFIEVSNVGLDKWRAQIRRTPGGSCAMMPFYGSTPDEAAAQLTRWLAIASGPRRDPIVS